MALAHSKKVQVGSLFTLFAPTARVLRQLLVIVGSAQIRNKMNTHREIRPHRFGGEGVLIGGQTATLNAKFVNIAVAISALAGGGGIETEFWVILVGFRQGKNGQK